MPGQAPHDRPFGLEDQLAIERDRRRRGTAALLYGADAGAATTPPGPWAPFVAGVVLAMFLVLAVAVATLIRVSFSPAAHPPAAHPSPTVSSR